MTLTLREAIAEMDAAADKFIEVVKPAKETLKETITDIFKRVEEGDFIEAEISAIEAHIDILTKRVNKAVER